MYFAGEQQQRVNDFRNVNEESHQENHYRQQKREREPQSGMMKTDKELTKVLELYNRVRTLDAQRESSSRSLYLAAAGVVILVGGAAATAVEKKDMTKVGMLVALFGGLTELCGLFVFVKSA